MSEPAVIDSLEFARSEQALAGELPAARLERLHDVLTDTEGTLGYTLRGGKDERQRPLLELKVDGELHLQCQRCLETLSYPVRLQSTLLLVPRGEQLDELMDDPSAPDAIEASAELDVAELVEDEVLLSLPLSPRHAEGTCESRTRRDENGAEAPSAFSQLAALRRAGDKT
jgi:uncharacterized protein